MLNIDERFSLEIDAAAYPTRQDLFFKLSVDKIISFSEIAGFVCTIIYF